MPTVVREARASVRPGRRTRVRATTKVWLISAAITLAVVALGTVIIIDRQLDERVARARQFNRDVVYTGIQLFIDDFSSSFFGGTSFFSPEDLQGFTSVGGISLVEVYTPDSTRLFSTSPYQAPSALDSGAMRQALRGATISDVWVDGSQPEGGERLGEIGLLRLLRGGQFADEFWGPARGPEGEVLGVTRALVALPGLREDAIAIVRENMLLGALLVALLCGGSWITLHVLIRKPLTQLTVVMRRIREGETSLRAPVPSEGELASLATSFNAMADELERQATTDSLTGLLNHRYANLALEEAVDQARARRGRVSVLLGDIDGFKLFNDTYGHPLGDEVLRLVTGVLQEQSGDVGIPCRYGGDEFLIILPGADKVAADTLAQRLAAAVGELEFQTGDGSRLPIRLSFGVASFPEDSRSKDYLLAQADGAMYEAKRLGLPGRDATGKIVQSGTRSHSAFAALDSLVQAIQYRDHYTKTHSDVVAEYAARLALQAGLSSEAGRALRIAGVLHDIGKLIVPDDILKKPGPLTPEEYEIMKRHPLVGEMLIQEAPFLEDVIQAVGCHHERFDGTGYPRSLRGEKIPVLGRVIAIADAYAAMCLDRPYRKALSLAEIVAELRGGAGTQFDPRLVEIFLDVLHVKREPLAA